ncbi:MAG: RHS repeat-associated core domain-containing protein [Stenotrophomonas sp.]|uniref:RHS repeat-associated core domain-containing protein n=1 Tax=Stenotrophomonas sp. TaxID=69392 RepID=UPI003D6D3426
MSGTREEIALPRSSPMEAQGAGGGARRADAPPGSAARVGYNGQLHERGGCWQFLGNGYRVYNPVLMRFHSPDSLSPFGKGGINTYAYCSGDPINCDDPTGHFLQYLFGAAAIGSVVGTVGAVASAAAGNSKLAGILGGVALAAGAAAGLGYARMSSVQASASRRAVRELNKVITPEMRRNPVILGGVTYHPEAPADIFVAHGAAGVTQAQGLVNGSRLAQQLKTGLGPDYPFKRILMVSCESAAGGRLASQAQVLSNKTGAQVLAYPFRSRLVNTGEGRMKAFEPQSGLLKAGTSAMNRVLHRYTLARWRVRRAMQRLRTQ